MFSANVKIDFPADAFEQRMRQRTYVAQQWLDEEVARESNIFAPMDTGALRMSVFSHSRFGTGILNWVTPYARRLYYGVGFKFATDRNPKATHHWFEAAKAKYLRHWGEGVAKILGGFWG